MQPRHKPVSTVARPVAPKGKRPAQRPVEKPVEFKVNLPGVKSVAVAGTFNEWDASRTPLNSSPGGGWKTTVWLPAGRYEYRFVADGQWISDPNARETVQNSYGGTNSVVLV